MVLATGTGAQKEVRNHPSSNSQSGNTSTGTEIYPNRKPKVLTTECVEITDDDGNSVDSVEQDDEEKYPFDLDKDEAIWLFQSRWDIPEFKERFTNAVKATEVVKTLSAPTIEKAGIIGAATNEVIDMILQTKSKKVIMSALWYPDTSAMVCPNLNLQQVNEIRGYVAKVMHDYLITPEEADKLHTIKTKSFYAELRKHCSATHEEPEKKKKRVE